MTNKSNLPEDWRTSIIEAFDFVRANSIDSEWTSNKLSIKENWDKLKSIIKSLSQHEISPQSKICFRVLMPTNDPVLRKANYSIGPSKGIAETIGSLSNGKQKEAEVFFNYCHKFERVIRDIKAMGGNIGLGVSIRCGKDTVKIDQIEIASEGGWLIYRIYCYPN